MILSTVYISDTGTPNVLAGVLAVIGVALLVKFFMSLTRNE